MIELKTTGDTIAMLLVAFGVGALGGLVAELLESRGKLEVRGALELPKRVSGRYFDLGFPATVLVGAVAAVAILYFFPPSQEVIKQNPNAAPTTTTEYDLTKLVALALIVGSAGSRFLSTLQARTVAAVAEEQTAATQAAAKTAVKGVADHAAALAKGGVAESASSVVEQSVAETPKDAGKAVKKIADNAAEAVHSGLEEHIKAAEEMIDSASAR